MKAQTNKIEKNKNSKASMGAFICKYSAKSTALLSSLYFLSACSPQGLNDVASSALTDSGLGESEQIIGGSKVESKDPIINTTVQILDMRKGTGCTGSLISSNLVLTAAHCTAENPTDLLIIFSSKAAQSIEELKAMPLRRVIGGFTDERWPKLTSESKGAWGDIAILKFQGTVPNGYKIAKLLGKANVLKDGMNITLAGFGLVDGVKKTDATELRKVDVSIAKATYNETEILLDQSAGRGACHGDSGGPALIIQKGEVIVAGVTSRGEQDPGDTCGVFSVYTSVAANLNWIQATAKKLMSPNFKPNRIPQPVGI
jgi:hypothetical protein